MTADELIATLTPIAVIVGLFLLVLAILWFLLPFAVFGTKAILKDILAELKDILAELKAVRAALEATQKTELGKPDPE